jgi:ribosome-associated heat shock protein Hsp15
MRLDQPIEVGDVLTLPIRQDVLAIEILALPRRRGPAQEAQSCYRALDGGQSKALGAQ